MVMVVGVRFKKAGKIYYFSPANLNVQKGNNVIVETARGMEFGKCVIKPKNIDESDVIPPLKNVLRIATEEDVKKHDDNKRREKEAFEICLEKIKQHNLKMKLIDVEYTFDNNKVIFYFTADGRVDFRELVKDLASIFRTRIELRQIGVRDEAKMIGGLGPCGRVMCCSAFLGDFVPVSIKMAKEQNLSLNPTKISGICGRLMCCLNYEQDAYEKIRQRLPKKGSVVNTVYGRGEVMSNSVVKESVKVKIKNEDGEDMMKEVLINQIEMVSGGFEGSINDEEIEVDVGNENSDVIKQLFKEE
ncbi:subunit of a sporulation, competence and biofilm formation regulatory complex of RNaseY (RicAFT complex / FAD / two (4Fe-4S)2+) [Clostridiaceae bacterium BL-3]|nr:subunit of a sporulation, competence and biofilm formation regulatory complex of RNaseY (RicAFT complex / FAD / two (4Fe-4S)2+) [Clostridiaceae bacterium BL-3]